MDEWRFRCYVEDDNQRIDCFFSKTARDAISDARQYLRGNDTPDIMITVWDKCPDGARDEVAVVYREELYVVPADSRISALVSLHGILALKRKDPGFFASDLMIQRKADELAKHKEHIRQCRELAFILESMK
jgi:hypothetical protein